MTRIKGLDGLRGIASILVLFQHIALMDMWWSNAFLSPVFELNGGIKSFLFYTPLRIFFSGSEAVCIFFILSGYVLSKAYPGRTSLKLHYFGSRLSRLYLPIWASLIIASVLTFFRPAEISQTMSWWHQSHFEQQDNTIFTFSLERFIGEWIVLDGTSWLNSSLWSMRVEVTISIILFVVINLAKLKWLGFAFSVILFFLCFDSDFSWLTNYLPFFIFGSLLANYELVLGKLAGSLTWIVGILAITFPWISRLFIDDYSPFGSKTYLIYSFVGSALIVVGALSKSSFNAILNNRFAQYLGTRSFSIYLIHAPLITFIGYWALEIFPDREPWVIVSLAMIAVVVALGELFFRLIENPSHKLSKLIGSRLRPKLN